MHERNEKGGIKKKKMEEKQKRNEIK